MFVIQTQSDVPIYRQLSDQLRRFVASGRLQVGEQLPSVRTVAADLAVNPMTVSKAYNLLETEGLLVRKRGVGMVVNMAGDASESLITPAISELVGQAKQLGLSRSELITRVKNVWEQQDAQ